LNYLLVFIFTLNQLSHVEVKGFIANEENKPLNYINISFYNSTKDSLLYNTQSDSLGFFKIKVIPKNYFISVSAIGYQSLEFNKEVSENIDFGILELKESSALLDEVVVKAKAIKAQTQTARGTIIDISNDTLLQTISALDVLSVIPQLRIDFENNILLNNVPARILINGKEKRINNDVLMDMLTEKKGSDIIKINMIDVPSSKYASTVQAIIDITLKKQKKNGYKGRVSNAWSNVTTNINSNISLDYKVNKWVFSSSNSFYNRRKEMIREINSEDVLLFTKDIKEQEIKNKGKSLNLGIDFNLNRKHSISTFLSYGKGVNSNSNENEIENFLNNTGFSQIINQISDVENDNSKTGELSYRFDIDSLGKRLDFSNYYFIKNNRSLLKNEYSETMIIQPSFKEVSNRDNSNNRSSLYSNRIDFSMPIKALKGEFELGSRVNIVSFTENNLFQNYNSITEAFDRVDQYSNEFEFYENSLISYISLSSNKGKLKYSLGFRGELINTKSRSLNNAQFLRRSFPNFLINTSIKYLLNKKGSSNLNLSFRQGYTLPSFKQLNNFTEFLSPNSARVGNPDLNQSRYYLIGLRLNLNNNHFFGLSLNNYFNIFNQIFDYDNGFTTNLYKNLGERNLLILNYSTSYKLNQKWRINLSAFGQLTRISKGIIDNEILAGRISTSHVYKLSNTFLLNMKLDYLLNTESNGITEVLFPTNFYMNLGASKSFFSNALRFRISIRDILGVYNNQQSIQAISNTLVTSKVTLVNPRISISMAFSFNKGAAVKKKTKKKAVFGGSRLNN